MTTKSKSLDQQAPPAHIQIVSEADSAPVTSMESSVDLFITFDEDANQTNAKLADNRLVDLTAQSEEEKERNYYKVLFDSAVDGVFIVDAETMRIVLANRTAADMYGFESEDDMLGVNPLKLVHPDDRDRVLRILAQDVIHDNLRLIHKFRGMVRDGNDIWVRAVGVRTEYRGRLAGLISIRDISDRRREEEERDRVEERLEFIGRLASIGELATGVGHEFNDPVSAILVYDQLLMSRRNLDETIKSGLEAIYRQAQRASTLIENLLLFGRRHRPDKCLVNINQLLERALDTCTHELEINDVQVSEDLDPDLPPTLADPDQIQQVFLNIINNADYAMAEAHGRGKLHVQSETRGDVIRVTLTDDGPGIPDEDLPHIFDPFFTSRGNGKGTGLGLTVCYGLVEAHGGSIDARSKLGEGTSIEVEIPIVTSENESASELNLDRLEL